MQTTRTLLVLDAEPDTAASVARCLGDSTRVIPAPTADDAMAILDARPVEVLVVGLRFAGGDALRMIATMSEKWPAVPVVVLTTEATMVDAVEALKVGAVDFLFVPFVREQVEYVVEKATSAGRRRSDEPPPRPDAILGESEVMREALSVLRRAAPGTSTILIRGESGTGKELIARAIHEQSARAGKPFIKIDCASLPDALLESELFGYEKGAFTGAGGRKPGRVELADGGTLFLDEIGELGKPLQAKLLRLLQDRQIERLGGTKTIEVDVRVVAATHRDLETMIERGQFRQDLFYRLNVVPLWLPPLRARRDDVEILTRHFLVAFASANGKPPMRMDAAAIKVLRKHRWPGNVRQLQNLVERLVVLSEEQQISESAVRAELSSNVRFVTQASTANPARGPENAPGGGDPASASAVGPLDAEIHEAERKALVRALRHAGGNRALVARLLGVSRSTLYQKLAEHDLS